METVTGQEKMTTISTQPGVVTTQVMSVEPGSRWTTDMCDCCDDCGICCCALWCFPCMMCNTVSEFGECMCLPLMDPFCMGYLGCSSLCPPITLAMRAAVRERYKIKGSICDDSVRSCCCYSCSWCQMAREIKRRGNYSVVTTAQTTIVTNTPVYPPHQGYTPLVEY
ncbi:cornifelin homolog [Spea bombifrons]|uniref:cornifelin homolog n=1 Tax=Spea bombifrons TaxID=233779 RepID=UPI00234A68A1|nr:cornifelin homolog [Spea bombifrons]